jgi:hypothetical protein
MSDELRVTGAISHQLSAISFSEPKACGKIMHAEGVNKSIFGGIEYSNAKIARPVGPSRLAPRSCADRRFFHTLWELTAES